MNLDLTLKTVIRDNRFDNMVILRRDGCKVDLTVRVAKKPLGHQKR